MSDPGKLIIQCPSLVCRRPLSIPLGARGKVVRCKICGTMVRIPELSQQIIDELPMVKSKSQS